jgi:hypothetical protein
MISWVELKLAQWGQWVQMNRGLGSKGLSASWGTVGGGGHATSFVPIKSLDCSRTDDWVRSLPKESQGMLLECYCTPHTAVENARVLKMSLRTLYSRLHELHREYAGTSHARQRIVAN